MTARTFAAPAPTDPHPFRPDYPGEYGYRPKCRVCGREWHPGPQPAPREGR